MCYVKMLAGLHEAGFSITVLTRDPASFDARLQRLSDDTLAGLVPAGVDNRRVMSWESNALFRAARKLTGGRGFFRKLFEPRGKEWYYAAVSSVKRTELDRYDVILSCSQPHVNHLIGYRLKQRTGKPWIAYFSDPWIDGPYIRYASEKTYRYNAVLEEKIISTADIVLFTSAEMAELVMRKYPGGYRSKCDVVPHSFVPAWYSLGTAGHLPAACGKTRILHTGHFYGPRTPMPLLQAVDRVNREVDLSESLEMFFFGTMDRKYHEFIRGKGLDRIVKTGATIPYLDSLALMKEADYLLLIDAPLSATGESVFLPSKLIDYVGSHRPVIGITPAKGASARVLGETGNVTCSIDDPDGIYTMLTRIAGGAMDAKPDPRGIARYHYVNTARTMERLLRSVA